MILIESVFDSSQAIKTPHDVNKVFDYMARCFSNIDTQFTTLCKLATKSDSNSKNKCIRKRKK